MAQLTDAGYLNEIKDLRLKLIDFLDHIQRGEHSYFKEIALKLRVLYFDKSGTKALLREVLNRYELEVEVLIKHTIQEKIDRGILPQSLGSSLNFGIHSTISWFLRGDEKSNPFDALERKEILVEGKYFSYREIIETIADKMAAHVDSTFPDSHLLLQERTILLYGLPIAQRTVVDTARVSIELIESLDGHISNGTAYGYIIRTTP